MNCELRREVSNGCTIREVCSHAFTEIEHSSGSDSEEKKKYKIMVPVEPKKKTELVGLTMVRDS